MLKIRNGCYLRGGCYMQQSQTKAYDICRVKNGTWKIGHKLHPLLESTCNQKLQGTYEDILLQDYSYDVPSQRELRS